MISSHIQLFLAEHSVLVLHHFIKVNPRPTDLPPAYRVQCSPADLSFHSRRD